MNEASRIQGWAICFGAAALALIFIIGLLSGSYWAVALPVGILTLFVLGLAGWVGYTIATIQVEVDPAVAERARLAVTRMLEVGRHEAVVLGRGLSVLDVVAVIAPLLGLLGTVWGMIAVFRAIEIHGVGNAGALAGGIETALYTTFAGLLVAIPVRVAHSFLQSRVDTLIMHMEELALQFLDLLAAGTEADKGGPE